MEKAGSNGTLGLIDLYVQTGGPYQPKETQPWQGQIVAVGIHHRNTRVVDGTPKIVESRATFELGTRQKSAFAIDPNGLIVREEVFHDADSLLAAGLTR